MLLSINICGSHLRIAGHYQSQSHNIAGENHDGALKLIFTILILNNFYRDFTLECHHQTFLSLTAEDCTINLLSINLKKGYYVSKGIIMLKV